jgi:hypothetical protein
MVMPPNAIDPPVATVAIERATVATGLTYDTLTTAFERELGTFKPDVAQR